jgi:dihydropteroate synthase
VLEGILQHRNNAILSVDTYKSETAAAALQAGAEIINDVSGFLWDEAIAKVCSAGECGVVLMHTRGRPEEWRTLPDLKPGEVVPLVALGLQWSLSAAQKAGVARERIVLDPGFGFGKILEQNYSLLAGLENLASLGHPLLAGVSRKRFLARTLAQLYGGVDPSVEQRGNASLAALTASILAGAHVVRVHDVLVSREAAAVADAVLAGSL